MVQLITSLLIITFAMGCSVEPDSSSKKKNSADANQGEVIIRDGGTYDHSKPGNGSSESDDSNGSGGSSDKGDDINEGSDANGEEDGGATLVDDSAQELGEDRNFFLEQVEPVFVTECAGCHADPRMSPPVQGPLSIFNHARMREMLGNGDGSAANELFHKLSGNIAHGGGNRCAAGSACDQVRLWWTEIFGDQGGVVGNLAGNLAAVSETGRVSGFAVNNDNLDEIVMVRAYIGSAEDQGTLIHEEEADALGYDGGAAGNHAFTFQLDAQYRDGTERVIRLFALIGTDEIELPGSPRKFTSFTPSPEGMQYFTANVQPLLQNRCGSCHAVDYSIQWASLLSPVPGAGGTATNNELINKPSGRVNHGGGNICGGLNGSPCTQIQEWYRIEFE